MVGWSTGRQGRQAGRLAGWSAGREQHQQAPAPAPGWAGWKGKAGRQEQRPVFIQ